MNIEKELKMDQYEQLVDELLKTDPDEAVVKNLMDQLQLKYSTNNIERLSAVLAYSPLSSHKEGKSNDL